MATNAVSSRRIPVNVLVHGQFAVLSASDSYTKVAGLTITPVVYKDGAVLAYAVTVAEVGSAPGEYAFSFTPNAVGYWKIEFRVAAQAFTYVAEFDVELGSAALADETFYDSVRDLLGNSVPYVTVNVYEAGTANLLYTTTTDFAGAYQIPLTGALANPILVDIEYTGGGVVTFKKQNVRLVV